MKACTTSSAVAMAWIISAMSPGLGVAPAAAKPPAGGLQEPVAWSLYSNSCTSPPANAQEVRCGGVGVFYIGPDTQSSCPLIISGSELPKVYSAPGPSKLEALDQLHPPRRPRPGTTLNPLVPPNKAGGDTNDSDDGGSGDDSGNGGEPPLPCIDGSCFSTPNAEDPWIAVVDWNSWHGWSTGWTTTLLSGLPVQLLDLEGPDLREFLGPSVSDAHLLVRLCEIAEGIEQRTFEPPTVLNMSFGRLFVDDASDGVSCDPEALSCQVGHVLDHLVEQGVVPIAAAGNHGSPLFPASYDAVLSAGSLDLARFRSQLEIAGSWESPSGPHIFLPGYGICLKYRGSDGREQKWPAPPGSSYSSALLSGWMADILTGWDVEQPLDIDWTMTWARDEDCFMLSQTVPQRCNHQVNSLLQGILDLGAECWNSSVQEPSLAVTPDASPTLGALDSIPSFIEWSQARHWPDPFSDPCVPCATGGLDQSLTGGIPSNKSSTLPEGDLVLDLTASSPLRPVFYYDKLYLRSGSEFHTLLDGASAEDQEALDNLSDANIASLIIQHAGPLLQAEVQPSLVFVMCVEPGNCCWNSIPVLH